jgi:hypothetical protein
MSGMHVKLKGMEALCDFTEHSACSKILSYMSGKDVVHSRGLVKYLSMGEAFE